MSQPSSRLQDLSTQDPTPQPHSPTWTHQGLPRRLHDIATHHTPGSQNLTTEALKNLRFHRCCHQRCRTPPATHHTPGSQNLTTEALKNLRFHRCCQERCRTPPGEEDSILEEKPIPLLQYYAETRLTPRLAKCELHLEFASKRSRP